MEQGFHANQSQMRTGLPDERLVFVDLETGGREPWRPIFELAAVAVDANLNELETFDVRLKFSRHMADPKVLVGSRYETASWRRRAICSDDAAEEFAEFLSRHGTVDQSASNGRVFQVAQMVAHHAAFDSEFLSQWFNRLGRFLPASRRMLCTMQRAIWLFHEDKSLTPPTDFKLPTLCQYFGIPFPPESAHEALFDVRATVSIYREMNKISIGQRSISKQRHF